MTAPWWTIDDDWDLNTSDGHSRLDVYLTQKLGSLDFYDERPDAVDWVCWCWDTATVPVMSPAYVSWAHPVANTRLFRDDWDGRLVAMVTVLTKVHLGPGWGTWQEDRLGRRWVEPQHGPTAVGEVVLTAPLDVTAGPLPSSPADVDVAEVKVVLGRVVGALRRRFGGRIDQLAQTALVP